MRTYAELQRTLLDELATDEHILTSDMDITTARTLWFRNSAFKKFEGEVSSDADSRCLELFKRSNKACQDFVLQPQSQFEEEVIGEVEKLFHSFFFRGLDRTLTLERVALGFLPGPGASLGVDSYNFYTKLFDSTLTSTSSRLCRYYRHAISAHPTWLSAENARLAQYGDGIVAGNRLSFVPKTSDISRSICTEPLLNMLFQKGLGSYLEAVLKRRFRIDLSHQPDFNRKLAQIGSLNGTFGTIDLSSASDSMSLRLMRRLIPPDVFWLFELSRSPIVSYPNGDSEELHMISSMGNAFTFPLQTLLFASIVVSCYRVLGIKPTYDAVAPSNFAVFGDDIIVRKDSYDFICRCLKLFGFTVNEGKSFNTGHFRESCGTDWFRGHDIRGVYIKKLTTSADVYSALNRIIRWCAVSGVLLPRTVNLLRSWVKFLPVPFEAGDAEGIKVPFPPPSLERDRFTGGVVYHALVKKSHSFRLPYDEAEVRKYPGIGRRGRKIFYNPSGLLLAFIGGYIRNGRVALRSEVDRFKVRRRITPSWRYVPAAGNPSLGNDWIVVADLLLSEQ